MSNTTQPPEVEARTSSRLLDENRFARAERETRLTLAAVTLVGLQGYVQGLDRELFRLVTLAALKAAALKEEARSEGNCHPQKNAEDPTAGTSL